MISASVQRLQCLCDTLPGLLSGFDEALFSAKNSPGKWSKKEIIGHLIDSATHNHHRLVRAQFEDSPEIHYDQDQWNRYNYYQSMPGSQVIAFWTAYNRQLLAFLKQIPQENLRRTVNTGGQQAITLIALVEDYVQHLEHHLQQVIPYNF